MKIRDVLVPIDFSPTSVGALEYAVEMMEHAGELQLMHVVDADFVRRAVDEGLVEEQQLITSLREKAERALGELKERYARPELNISVLVVVGRPAAEILRIARDLKYEMIIMGTEGRFVTDVERALFGSTAERVLRRSDVPVVTVPYAG